MNRQPGAHSRADHGAGRQLLGRSALQNDGAAMGAQQRQILSREMTLPDGRDGRPKDLGLDRAELRRRLQPAR
jgi:hypothetical protein